MAGGHRGASERLHVRSFHHADFDLDRLRRAKGSRTVSICVPARDEESTISRVVAVLRDEVLATGLADELIVVDDHSRDATAERARLAGATVVPARDVLAEWGTGPGKGQALWKSLYASSGDIVLWCDADIEPFHARFVTGVLGPLLCEPGVDLVKGHYRRPEVDGTGGGRVSELVARPLLSLLFPELAGLHQPLSGEYGGTREALERLPFVHGYGVEIGLLIDYVTANGTGGLVQVDLDERCHRNRALAELGPQAMAVAQTILHRADPGLVGESSELIRPGRPPLTVDVSEHPPMRQVRAAGRVRAS
jgi:glucosyl-3-phosphoglycerate synthase